MDKRLEAFKRLLDIMDDLRSKCPWDKEQTLESLRHLTIEEVYELGDAIIDKDMKGIKEELGDLMLHMVFYAKIASETNDFDISDALNGICEKLIARHPHIYADVKVNGQEDVKANWEQLKLAEGKKSILEGVPKSLPALVKAFRIQEKAVAVGFDWDNRQQVWAKVEEEMNEFHEMIEKDEKKPSGKTEEEFGDLLFSLINYARFVNLNPENALEKTNNKFIKRFQYIEKQAEAKGKKLTEMSLQEMDIYWEEAKNLK
ncbi:MAG: nucleoside triphosphate pyrophosphohydrolase [Bacteroidetes bacterium]|nr:MAG: nucleoside triphosphate pyrophosphohydrolase [Bacteroidota bacterium]